MTTKMVASERLAWQWFSLPDVLMTYAHTIKKWMLQWFALADADVVLYAAKVTVWGRWFIWLFAAVMLAYRPGLWYPEDIGYLLLNVMLATLNGVFPLPDPDKQAGDMALDARPQRLRHCADHSQHRRQRQVRQLHIHYLLSRPWRLCRDLYLVSAKHGLGYCGSSQSRSRELGCGLRSGP